MKATKLSVALVCALSAFSALCATAPMSHAADISLSELDELSTPGEATQAGELRIEPVMAVRHSDAGAESLYRLGRHHQQASRLDEAASAYRAALQKDAGHIEARNALATIHFAQRNLGAAMAEFKSILQQRPGLSHVHSNLGYAYMLEENYAAAMPELAQAILIDPSNTRAFGNLTLAYERLGAMVKEGRARSEAVAGVAGVAGTAGAAETATEAAPAAAAQSGQPAQPESALAAAVGMEEQKGSIASAPADFVPAQSEPEPGTAASIEVVIANGTRDEAMAGRIADGLRRNGVNVGRIADLAPYRQQRTVILYRDGYRKKALELSRMFAVPPAVVDNTRTRDAGDRSTVRLVLGKRSAQAEIRMASTQLASAR